MRFLLLITAFVTCTAWADSASPHLLTADHPVLQPYTAVYEARYNRLPIQVHRHLRHAGDSFVVTTEARNLLGRIHEEEHFSLDSAGTLLPGTYVYDRSILGTSRKETVAVDVSSGTSVSQRKGERTVLDFEPGQLGPLSYQVAMAHDLATGAERLSYRVIHRGRVRDYTYEIQSRDEELKTPLGTLTTVMVERVRDDNDRETVLWLAPELNYLPVKLRQVEDGEAYEMHIKSFTLRPMDDK